METNVIPAEARKPGGRHANRFLREKGLLPAIVYGHNEPPESVSLPTHDTLVALEHGTRTLTLKMGKKEQHVLIKELQFDHLGSTLLHMDLARVDLNETIHVRVPIDYRGTPVGTHDGGQLDLHLKEIEVECLTSRIPDKISVKIDHLGLNESLHVREVQPPEGITLTDPPDEVLCTVRPPIKAAETVEETVEEETGSEPEVISRGKAESEQPES